MTLAVILDGAKLHRRRNPRALQGIGIRLDNYGRLATNGNADGVGVLRERDLDPTVQLLGNGQPLRWRRLQLA